MANSTQRKVKELFTVYLESQGLRKTPERYVILEEIYSIDDHFEIEILWEELYHKLATISDDIFESVALDYFDFTSWAEAKLKRKSFDHIIREKYNLTLKAAS